jgi:MYXO-CTERM domain-containing protein
MKRGSCAVLLLGLTLATPGFADLVTASGAGSLPSTAENLSGDLSLSEIQGTLAFPDGVDMFEIDIVNPLDFSAYTVDTGAFGVPDPELFLFDSNGVGVYENDDASASNTQACLPSADSSNPCASSRNGAGPTAAGIYYLAITRSANSPLSDLGYIFSPLLSTDVVGPDPTQGGADPIIGWDNGVFTSPNFDLVNFDIVIQDTPASTPEPAAWTLAVLFAAFLLVRRYRGRAVRP